MVTLAPRLEVVDTLRLAAEVTVLSKSRAPVMVIAPKSPLVPPPMTPSNSTSDEPTAKLMALPSEASELIVLLKVI